MKKLCLALAFIFLSSPAFAQNKGTPISTTGIPAQMLNDAGTPTGLGYPCDASHKGIPYYNTTPGIGRPLWLCDGTTWQQAASSILGNTASIGGALLALGGSVSGTATVSGATAGSNCLATRNDGALLPVGLVIDCSVPSANTATVRIAALIAGTPTAATYNVRVIQ